jgi:hypothetical protein
MSIVKTTYYRGRVIEVNATLSVMAISREFNKFTYYRGFRVIEGRITEVLLYNSCVETKTSQALACFKAFL